MMLWRWLVCKVRGHARPDDSYRHEGRKYLRCSRCQRWHELRPVRVVRT